VTDRGGDPVRCPTDGSPIRLSITGPTGSGKSALAIALAAHVPDLELVSADAFLVYRAMDVGTAKPSASERAAVPHHLIDIVEPWEQFSVADFQRRYRSTVADLGRRGAAGVLVGGTGLYQRIVIDDFELPGQWPEIRADLEREVAEAGPAELHRRLMTLDAVAAGRMEPSNTRRIVRALEVCIGSGRAFSSFGPGLETYRDSDVIQIGLRWERSVLCERIEARVLEMITGGFVEEVVALLQGPRPSRTALQAVGYRQIIDVVEGRLGLDEATAEIIAATTKLAARQQRWFRRDPRLRWVDIEADPVAEALPVVLAEMRV